jgi:hypothetical protein
VAQPLSLHVGQPAKMRNRIQTDPREKQDGVAKLRVKIPQAPRIHRKLTHRSRSQVATPPETADEVIQEQSQTELWAAMPPTIAWILRPTPQLAPTRKPARRSGFCLLQLTDPLLECSILLPPRLALPLQCSSFLPRLLDQLLACSVLLCRKQPPVSAIDICERCRLKRLVGRVGEFSIMIYLAQTAHNVSF